MNNNDDIFDEKKHSLGRVSYMLIFIILIATIGIFYTIQHANNEYKRDIHNWAIRLAITTDIRTENVEKWVSSQYKELEAVANNLSLKLYFTELNLNKESNERLEEIAQITFLRNFLESTAGRAGFASSLPASKIRANIAQAGDAGIALLDNLGQIIVTTSSMPIIQPEIEEFIKKSQKGKAAMKDIYMSADGTASIAFIVPVYAVQGDHIPSQQVGVILGIRKVNELFDILKQPKSSEKTSESILIRKTSKKHGFIEHISPLIDGTEALSNRLDLGIEDYYASFALKKTGSFGIKADYNAKDVLVTSRNIKNTQWVLLHKIDSDEALEESNSRRVGTIAIGLLLILVLAIFILAIWRHGSSIRYKKLAKKFRSHERLLRLVTDNQPDSMFILDKDDKYCFVNLKAAQNADGTSEEIVGKKISAILGPKKAHEYQDIKQHALDSNEKISHVRKITENNEVHVIQSRYIPLEQVPRVLTGEITSGVLIVEQDITDAVCEREKRELILKQLVDTLVTIVDKRDSDSAHHSMRVSFIAEAIANEIHLDNINTETAIIAGKLMNIGKILMPKELLRKKEKLTNEEKKQVSECNKASADFIANLEFNGPVVETLRQAKEHWNGSGTMGLKEDEILITARIITLANDFVAMVSPRSYRPKIDINEALEKLMDEIGQKYERKIVIALINYLDNQEEPLNWSNDE